MILFDIFHLARCHTNSYVFTFAAAHDVGHPGRTNIFLVKTYNPLAIKFNDCSVLESYSVQLLWQLIFSKKHAAAFSSVFPHNEFKLMRKLSIDWYSFTKNITVL